MFIPLIADHVSPFSRISDLPFAASLVLGIALAVGVLRTIGSVRLAPLPRQVLLAVAAVGPALVLSLVGWSCWWVFGPPVLAVAAAIPVALQLRTDVEPNRHRWQFGLALVGLAVASFVVVLNPGCLDNANGDFIDGSVGFTIVLSIVLMTLSLVFVARWFRRGARA